MPAEVFVREGPPSDGGSCFEISVGDELGSTPLLLVSIYGVSMPKSNVIIGPDLLWLLPFAVTLHRRMVGGACKTAAQARLLLSSRPVGQRVVDE